ncbi:unnamed protein product [Tilletia laevis]|uniref:Uncharacterized protein n=3 Tax=Tilletia TaxID=13289 RepID=A0A8X7MVL3_9BASI|nr:hypothetical protein CF336_g2293 [Tilletia laevis]KAE8202576.1 hypothetical protein CF328_g2131 [Tilletia controversa]KAE8263304.1 hypothetical protein A4X03_0g1777 [Tilletia caries]KAE8206858.1 hypothetical protein CF335_g1561 [Tilletia laevis]KAE8251650.1 hypothetical protein A4X06_0g2595 [Tilletia controversa]
MQLNSKLSLVLCALLVAQPIASSPAASDNSAAELAPRSENIGSGQNKGLDVGKVFGNFFEDNKKGGDDHGDDKGKGHGGHHRFAEKKLKALKAAENAKKHKDAAAVKASAKFNAAAAKEDSQHKEADLKKFKKEKKQKSGKDGFGGGFDFDRRDGFGLGSGLDFGGEHGSGHGKDNSGHGGDDKGHGKSKGKGFGGSNKNKKEKVEKITKHLDKADKHKAVAKINAAAKFKAAAAKEDLKHNKAIAKKLAEKKKKSGSGKGLF